MCYINYYNNSDGKYTLTSTLSTTTEISSFIENKLNTVFNYDILNESVKKNENLNNSELILTPNKEQIEENEIYTVAIELLHNNGRLNAYVLKL